MARSASPARPRRFHRIEALLKHGLFRTRRRMLAQELGDIAVNVSKPPRVYAAEIIQLRTLEQRRAAVANVPQWCRGLV